MDLDQDLRWLVLIQLAGFNHPQLDVLVAAQKAVDKSYVAELALIAIDAALPDVKVKQRWIAEFEKTTGRLSAQKQKTAMYHLFPAHQSSYSRAFSRRLIDDLIDFDVDRDQKFIGAMVNSVISKSCIQKNVDRLQQTIDNNPQLGLIALKGLKEIHQATQHCVALNRLQ